MPRLRRWDPSGPGIARRRAGKGFVYTDSAGVRIADPAVRDRIHALAIPPAWERVVVCPWPNGHLQAVGFDARGRRQYRYHEAWRVRRDAEKFEHMVTFAGLLPPMRRQCDRLLDGERLDRDRVLACAVRLLDIGFFRVGGEEYAEDNGSFGLATVLKEHVRVGRHGAVTFDYTAKSGQHRISEIVDPEVHAVIGALKRRRGGGPELLAYKSDSRWHDVRSSDINAFVKTLTDETCCPKDFRTWSANVMAAAFLAGQDPATSPRSRKRVLAACFREVSAYLGNTPAVCRSSYVDPRVVDRYVAGVTIEAELARAPTDLGARSVREAVEAAVIDLLTDEAVEAVAA